MKNRPGTHNPLFRWSCTVLQNVFEWFLHDLNMLEYLLVWVCVYMCLCDCLCVSVVFLFVCSV